jgi:ubiquinone/menaquinone biosynthesis C-methylase UbiE
MGLRAFAKTIPFAKELWNAGRRTANSVAEVWDLPFSRKLRIACERATYSAGMALHLRDPLVPPGWMFRDDPNRVDGSRTLEEFQSIGRGTIQWAIDYQGLRPTHRFLDVGCGIGRMAIPLASYLESGNYRGFDISEWKITHCRRTVGRARPDFDFRHADVFNKYYNPDGRVRACEFRFPWDDESFDFVLLTSVFTHMLPSDMEHYLSEVARVLSVGGKCVISYSLTDSSMGPPYHSVSDVCEVYDPEFPEHGVIYLESFVRELYERQGLRIETLMPSSIRGKPDSNPNSRQDIVIAIKSGRPTDPRAPAVRGMMDASAGPGNREPVGRQTGE